MPDRPDSPDLQDSQDSAPSAGAAGAIAADDGALSVSEVSRRLRDAVEGEFGFVRIRGEIGRVSRPASGHIYLDLKDDKAVLAAVLWKGRAVGLNVEPESGLEVVCEGRLTIYPPQSRYQLTIDTMRAAGVGALAELLEARRRKWQEEGLFALERKRPLPFAPRCVGVVTSPSGAVIRDILHRIGERFPMTVLLWPIRVQGEGCAEEAAAAIRGFNALPEAGSGEAESDDALRRPDVLILARGGGSLEDLWGFNEEAVVRAAALSAIPTVSAIGHETDVTLLDFVADKRAPTPTAAAEIVTPSRRRLMEAVGGIGARLSRGVANALASARGDLAAAARILSYHRDPWAPAAQRLDHTAAKLLAPLRRRLERAAADVERAGRLLEAVDYRKTLKRGYAVVRDARGAAIVAAGAVRDHADISIEWADGKRRAQVKQARNETGKRRRDQDRRRGEQKSLL